MKKVITLISLFIVIFVFSQGSNYQEVELSRDVDRIERFIQENPKHPKNGNLRYLLIKIRREERKARANKKKSYSIRDFRTKIARERASVFFDDIPKENLDEMGKDYSNNTVAMNSKTDEVSFNKGSRYKKSKQSSEIELINHLFSTSKNKIKAYLQIRNKSNCIVKLFIKGRNNYTLEISPKDEGHILVLKGTYEFSGKLCDKTIAQTKKIKKDMVMSLGN